MQICIKSLPWSPINILLGLQKKNCIAQFHLSSHEAILCFSQSAPRTCYVKNASRMRLNILADSVIMQFWKWLPQILVIFYKYCGLRRQTTFPHTWIITYKIRILHRFFWTVNYLTKYHILKSKTVEKCTKMERGTWSQALEFSICHRHWSLGRCGEHHCPPYMSTSPAHYMSTPPLCRTIS